MSILRSWFRLGVLKKGLTGQSNFWTIMAIFSGMRWLKRRFGAKQPVTVFAEPLRPGEKYSLVYNAPPKGRKARREERILSTLRAGRS